MPSTRIATISIHAYVKAKLIGHGVQNSGDGRIIISDKRLFPLAPRR